MKLVTTLIMGLLLSITPAFGELTPADIEKIRSIVKEEVTASETRMKEHVSQEIEKVNIKISEMDKRLTGEIQGLDKRLDQLFMLVLALVACIAVVVGVPQILVALQRKDLRAQDEKIEALQREMEALRQERTVGP